MARQKNHTGKTPAGSFNDCCRILEDYLDALNTVRKSGAGVAETSYYPALSNLFNAVGKTLKPQVRCVMNLKNLGAGMPDGGLFTAEQFQRQADSVPQSGQLPARGAIEAKGTRPSVQEIAASQQVRNYLKTYGIVLVTNLREFLIVERGPSGEPVPREAFVLAKDEPEFWRDKAAQPRATAHALGEQFVEFLKRACLHAAPLTNPKDVAWFLASYARDALFRVERQQQLPTLQAVRAALEEALGMKFTDQRGEHFFHSTLVQTLFYGVFSAWVRWHKDNPGPQAKFDWRTAEWSLHVPFIKTLYEEVAKPSRLGPLGLVEVLDWTAGVLNRVDRAEFFSRFEDEHAVQYFYEPFLEAYDPQLRKALGVWYTPPEIVKYQVARVDAVLREELGLPDGLADPNVIVLDPCCGTGAYLVEVLHRIAATLRDKGGDGLVASDLKQAAMHRVFGFEIMPAPYVVAHLQLSSLLQNQGAPLAPGKTERVGIYLTNALTGWQPPKGPKARFLFPELEEERDAAEQVKRDKKILVVLGNPPYNAFAGVSPAEEEGLVEPYKVGLNRPVSEGGWGIKKFNLDDLYVRFFRLAERRIAEMTGKGVVSFISNHSWVSEPSFVVLRQRLLNSFDKFWIENLHGNRKISEYAPDGRTSETIFAISGFSVGIQQGVVTSLWVKSGKSRKGMALVRFRDDINDAKAEDRRRRLLDSLNAKNFNKAYALADPRPENRYSFRPENVADHYTQWPRLVELCALPPSNGLMEKRGGALIDIDRDALEARMRDYFNAHLSWEEYKARQTALTKDAARFVAKDARAKAIENESFNHSQLRRYALRPFDTRWCYYTPVRPIWNEPRPALWAQLWPGNRFLIARFRSSSQPEGRPMSFTSALLDDHYIVPDAVAIPLGLRDKKRLSDQEHATLFDILGDKPPQRKTTANLSKPARAYLAKLGIKDPDADPKTAGLLWMHALAIGYSPAYLSENADGIRRDWPRIPLPDSRKALEASAALGEQVAALLDTEADVPGVTSGKIAPLLKTIGLITKVGGGAIDPSGDDLAVTAGWGHRGKDGVVMPAKGKVNQRPYRADEQKAIADEAKARGMKVQEVLRLLGEETLDVYLNEMAYWRNVPVNVWNYYIGGYQVIKKWLSYREHDILGRTLRPEEAREVTNMARRITAIILLQPRLDANYRNIAPAAFSWPPS
ncbi:type ISP restriction/modification enzyme [Chloracidobacterium aggregatum]|uniref:type ISP restriction/modification enzyme n=1 Tax=Chloracidobacterium aggregatum TaxID=2851959 RepID=UPI001B8D928E|nr:type ISP restriction/modification enzyme [Chloracidobacterium aggregatum]QUV86130.1 N-6 DNA methylase [Chloracidobacterium sp. 2]QUV89424.1 N-6 DNA methylase [Chloracidobacterium sp. S]QUV98255.1 N-6 DNA methylase [Chloracidobacterium sp. E]